jgi:tetratricopeptide (TPR) repeat protein
MPTNVNAKTFPEDAENEVETPEQRRIFGVIKVFLSNIQNCTIIIKCKIITGTVEIHNCHNVTIQIEKDATVATIQIDLSSNMNIDFHDAVSGKNIPSTNEKKTLYWGDDKDDRIFHAGVSNMHVRIYRDGFIENEITTDYIKDGAEAIGNSTLEEYQFITSCHDGQLITENVVRTGHTTGTSVRAMTQRELAVEKEKRDRAAKCAIKMADDMIQIKDKDGNVLVRKTDVPSSEESKEATNDNHNDNGEDDDVEEVYTTMSSTDIQLIINECDQLKKRGNEAYSAGEYGQAILHYSLCLDKASELPDMDTDTDCTKKSLYPRDIIYTNRSAAFLKLGQHEKANDDASKALQIQPENIKANFRKGLALHASGQYDVALPFLVKAYKMEPNNKQIKQAIQFCEVRLEQEYRKRMSQS